MIRVAIREAAEKRGITTAYQLMKAAKIQPSVAAKWWSNEFDKIAINTLDKLCDVLDCTPNDLLVYTPKKEGKTK